MKTIRQLDISLKLYLALAILTCCSGAMAFSIVTQVNFDAQFSLPLGNIVHTPWLVLGLGLTVNAFTALLLARWLRGELARPIRAAVQLAQRVAAGDLRARSGGAEGDSGPLGRAMREMSDKLLHTMLGLRGGIDSVAQDAGENASASLDLARRAGQHTALLQETAASMALLTTAVRNNAEFASEAGALAASTCAVARDSAAALARVAGTIGAIDDGARRIAHLVCIIDDLAYQTNMLALNAAVEAARSADGGRAAGGAALEARNLAQRSAAAARELKRLMDDAANSAHAGASLASQAGCGMAEVVARVQRLSGVLDAIAGAGEQQSTGLERAGQSFAALAQASAGDAAMASQAAARAAATRDQAGSLARAAAAFALGPEHGAAPRLRLVASNPAKFKQVQRSDRARPTMVPVALDGTTAPAAGQRWAAAKQDVDWHAS